MVAVDAVIIEGSVPHQSLDAITERGLAAGCADASSSSLQQIAGRRRRREPLFLSLPLSHRLRSPQVGRRASPETTHSL